MADTRAVRNVAVERQKDLYADLFGTTSCLINVTYQRASQESETIAKVRKYHTPYGSQGSFSYFQQFAAEPEPFESNPYPPTVII
jgi:hypothetical protein